MSDTNIDKGLNIPRPASVRKSDHNGVTDSHTRTLNHETLGMTPQLVPNIPEIEPETSPFIRSISPLVVRGDTARHVVLDSNRLQETGPLECDECGMVFSRSWLLEFHQANLCCGYVSQDDMTKTKDGQHETLIRQLTALAMEKDVIKKNILEQDNKKVRWIACADGNVTQFAVKAGYDTIFKCNLYVCRATVEGEKIPGQVVPTHNCAFVTLNGKEVSVTEYDVLTDPQQRLAWKRCDVKGAMPRGTQVGGYDANKLMYFIARGRTPDGNHCSGKYVPQDRKCYFAWQDQEMSSDEFDFLCKK